MERTLVIGAGPAGLTAAWELTRLGLPAIVFEQDACVGGIARTVAWRGHRFDIGGHRFFTKVPAVQQLWEEMLGPDFLVRPRLSRIFYRNRFFDYPLRPLNALRGLGALESLRVGLSYARARLAPHPEERSFEHWVRNRFGRRLYEIFFKTYTEKVWGVPCHEIGADWAAQRIQNLDLGRAVRRALLGSGGDGRLITTLIERFQYPRFGPGMMWERMRDRLAEKGVPTRLGAQVVALHHADGRIQSVGLRHPDGREERVEGAHCISSMPVRELVRALDPAPPVEIRRAAERLRYRDFLTVGLLVERAEVFPDNWIYVHSADVELGRIQNFKNWSADMVADASQTLLGLEYFVQEGDALWAASDAELVALGTRECEQLGLIEAREVSGGTVVRMPKAYPVYANGYAEALDTVRSYLASLENLQLIGRNGQHRYNNQDHSMVTGMYAARNVAGENLDVWSVNVEQEYHEELAQPAARRVPGAVERPSDAEIWRAAFARYDPVALGGAVGSVLGLGLLLATAVLLLRGGEVVGPNLSLLGHYLFGYRVSWAGALVGLIEGALGGFVFGFAVASAVNRLLRSEEGALLRRIERIRALDLLEGEAA